MTQSHILQCNEYQTCFADTATHFDITEEEVREILARRDPDTQTREEFRRLGEVEDHLSAKLLAKISGMERPARARE